MFFAGFLKHPVMVGSVIPSSDRLIDKMLAPVDWQACKLFVEYGPGVGTFCRPILDRMAPDAQFIAIDTNPDFIAYLRHTIPDPRFSANQRLRRRCRRDHPRPRSRKCRLRAVGAAVLHPAAWRGPGHRQ